MNKESLEHLSALMDGEISRETGMFLTRRMGSDEELSRSWERYHLIRDCMQRPGGQLADSEMCRKLRERLANEQAAAGQRKRSMPAWLKPVSGLAVAASVALVAIITVGPAPSPDGQPGANSADTAPRFNSPNILPNAPASQAASFSTGSTANNRRLDSYLLRHNQLSGAAGRQGFVSFVPIVSTPVQAQPEADTQPPEETEQSEQVVDR
jgi:sigma-E factor negative regulatory protein RseA